MKYQAIIYLLLSLWVLPLAAQNPIPAPPQSEKIVIQNATVHVGNGEVIQNGELRLVDGKIERIGTSTRELLSDYTVVDAGGKHVFPGMIALNTTLGMVEISAVRSINE